MNDEGITESCVCDTCGKHVVIPGPAAAPVGWFFLDIKDPDGGVALGTVLACSEECKQLPWSQA